MNSVEKCSLPDVYYSVIDEDIFKILVNEDNKKYIEEKFEKREDAKWKRLAFELQVIKRQLKELQEREQDIKDLLIGMSGHVNSIGGGIQVQKIVKKGVIEYSRIPQLQELDLEDYRKPPSEYWQIKEV